MTVLERSAGKADSGGKGSGAQCRCLECGEPFPRSPRAREFCGRKCVRTWSNRRMLRGAEVLDLLMAARFDREKATAFKVWRTLNRLAALYRDEDKARRDGRRSWRRIEAIREAKPFLWNE